MGLRKCSAVQDTIALEKSRYRKKIKKSIKPLSTEDTEHYCDLFETLLDYDQAYALGQWISTSDDKRITRSVVKGKIVEDEGI